MPSLASEARPERGGSAAVAAKEVLEVVPRTPQVAFDPALARTPGSSMVQTVAPATARTAPAPTPAEPTPPSAAVAAAETRAAPESAGSAPGPPWGNRSLEVGMMPRSASVPGVRVSKTSPEQGGYLRFEDLECPQVGGAARVPSGALYVVDSCGFSATLSYRELVAMLLPQVGGIGPSQVQKVLTLIFQSEWPLKPIIPPRRG